jgi:Cap4 SAVED domain
MVSRMFYDWCEIDEASRGERKKLCRLDEKEGGRESVKQQLVERVRSHYDDLKHIAEDVERLGFPGASAILAERLPRTPIARSGEMGEILATEFIEFQTGFRIPVRRLRYKDGREMALRGDDFLGVSQDDDEALLFLKGEAKSGQAVTGAVVGDARRRLSSDDGRPTPISLLFVADRLLEAEGDDKELGRKIRDEVVLRAVPPQRITHGLFTLSGYMPEEALQIDLDAADGAHSQISATLHIHDHQAFIAETYEEAGNLGDR